MEDTNKPNHICPVCGKAYRECDICHKREGRPAYWRQFTDTLECFQIWLKQMEDADRNIDFVGMARRENKQAIDAYNAEHAAKIQPAVRKSVPITADPIEKAQPVEEKKPMPQAAHGPKILGHIDIKK